jgi:hypothetical protein
VTNVLRLHATERHRARNDDCDEEPSHLLFLLQRRHNTDTDSDIYSIYRLTIALYSSSE